MVRPGYKQTEVGEIPEDWDVCKLCEISNIKGGKRLPKGNALLDTENGYPYIRVADMRVGGVNLHEIKYVPEHVVNIIKNYRIAADDLFISVAGTLGIIGQVPNELDNANLTENADKITNIICSKKFLLYSLLSERIQNEIASQSTIGAQPKLALGRIENFKIILPKDSIEQKAIAKALSDVDELIASLEKLIAKKRDIKTATMQQLLTGKKRLPGFKGSWKIIKMAKDATLNARIGWQALTTNEYLEFGAFHLVTGTDFIDGRINWNTCHFVDEWRFSQDRNIQLKEGDVLLTKDGTIGKVGYVNKLDLPATLNSGVFVIRPVANSFHPLFLYYILSSRIFDDFLSKITAGSTITHLYQKDFVTFEFFAPEIKEQIELAKLFELLDTDIVSLEKRLLKTKSIKQGMMQELLTGRTRLVDPQEIAEEERMHGT